MVGIIKLFALRITNFVKKLFGLPLRLVLLVILIDLPILIGVFLASERTTRQINRLEQDLAVVEDTQIQVLQQIASKSATPTPQVRPISVVGVK